MARTTIPAELVAVNAIQGTLIADNSITAVHIATNAISGTLVADNAITSTHIAQNNVTATQIAQNTITVTQIADSAVETAKINNDAVTQAKIADDAIGPDQLAANAVVSASIANGTIVEADMGDNAITLAKMASLARGSIIYGDSAGDPSALAIGSNDYVLTSDGTDIAWEAAGGTTINNNADNRVITGSGTANTLEGESTLTYDVADSGTYNGKTLTADYSTIPGHGINLVLKNTNDSSQYSRGSRLSFQASDGSATKHAAFIRGGRESRTSGGYLYFETADSSWNTPTERLRIDSSGHVLPAANNTYDLGSTAKGWRNIYTNDLNLSNMPNTELGTDGKADDRAGNDVDGSHGSWTIQEGANDLFLINRNNGKKYKFNLTEVTG